MVADQGYLRAALSGAPQQFQRTLLDPDGGVRHAQLSFTPYRSSGEKTAGVVVHMVDITERVNTEAQMRRQSELRAGQRERALLASRMTSEVMHPLFGATLDLSGLMQHADPTVRRQAAKSISGIDAVLTAIRSILRLERAEPDTPAGDGPQNLGASYALTAEIVAANVADLITVQDSDGCYRWVSPSSLSVTGWLPEQLLGQPHPEFIHPDDRRILERGKAANDRQTAVAVEYRYRRPDGTYRWVEDTAQPLAPNSAHHMVIVTTRDITERRHLQAALAEAKDTLEQAFTAAPIGMALVGPDGRWLTVNPAVAAITGRTQDQLLASTFQDITHPDDLNLDLELLAEVVDGHRDRYQMTKRYVHIDGHAVWVQLNVACLRNPDTSVRFFISQIVPIATPPEAAAT
ncbi:PAS domain S-box-containing protein [Friedmanniella luteola]|uniref:PAS domain S-box-containing protein n=2 Tax=Friedmanniella luteola TaxID=546871 RepID=A0A1H1WLA4_9ACTN|nr:PAS domain S-box-containing protein [Friedmanniella luteola]